jgi:hypothetical protein
MLMFLGNYKVDIFIIKINIRYAYSFLCEYENMYKPLGSQVMDASKVDFWAKCMAIYIVPCVLPPVYAIRAPPFKHHTILGELK